MIRPWCGALALLILLTLTGCLNPTSTEDTGARDGSGTTNGSGAGGGDTAGGGATIFTGDGSTGDTSGGDSGGAAATDADRILELVNTERTSRGLSALTRDDRLDAAAERHALDMRTAGFFAHGGSDGSDVSGRASDSGYTWSLIGENIAQGQPTPEAVMDAWMNSSGHRGNILNGSYEHLGVGIDANGSILWVQVFGAER